MMDVPAGVWVHPDVEVRLSAIEGRGLFATAPIAADVVVLRLGGRVVSTAELHQLFDTSADYVDTVAIGDDRHVVLPSGTLAHHVNHGCEPTVRPVAPLEHAARIDLVPGDELTLDYGLISDDPAFRMDCNCGAPTCRGVITGRRTG